MSIVDLSNKIHELRAKLKELEAERKTEVDVLRKEARKVFPGLSVTIQRNELHDYEALMLCTAYKDIDAKQKKAMVAYMGERGWVLDKKWAGSSDKMFFVGK